MGKKHLKWKVFLCCIVIALAVAGIKVYQWAQKPESRLLLAIFDFSEHTLKDPGYLLYDVDIMEVCREYANADVKMDGNMALWEMKQPKSTVYYDISGERSFSQKKMIMNSKMKLLWYGMGDIDFYAKEQTLYLRAPLLGDDIGYAFPTEINYFPQMPNMTSDISQEWFEENRDNIIQFTKDIEIEETGKTIKDKKGVESEEFAITIPKGSGKFLWDLFGMDAPDYDVSYSLYLTKKNKINKVEVSLDHSLPGAKIVLEGEHMGTSYFSYELPEDERFVMKMYRNPKHTNWMTTKMLYEANNGKNYTSTYYITWTNDAKGYDIKLNDIILKCDETLLAKGFAEGRMEKATISSDVFGEMNDTLEGLQVVDWHEVRDDTDSFIHEVLSQTPFGAWIG